jgi:hypothetical protein
MAKRKSDSPSNWSQKVTTVSEVRALAGELFNKKAVLFRAAFLLDITEEARARKEAR